MVRKKQRKPKRQVPRTRGSTLHYQKNYFEEGNPFVNPPIMNSSNSMPYSEVNSGGGGTTSMFFPGVGYVEVIKYDGPTAADQGPEIPKDEIIPKEPQKESHAVNHNNNEPQEAFKPNKPPAIGYAPPTYETQDPNVMSNEEATKEELAYIAQKEKENQNNKQPLGGESIEEITHTTGAAIDPETGLTYQGPPMTITESGIDQNADPEDGRVNLAAGQASVYDNTSTNASNLVVDLSDTSQDYSVYGTFTKNPYGNGRY